MIEVCLVVTPAGRPGALRGTRGRAGKIGRCYDLPIRSLPPTLKQWPPSSLTCTSILKRSNLHFLQPDAASLQLWTVIQMKMGTTQPTAPNDEGLTRLVDGEQAQMMS